MNTPLLEVGGLSVGFRRGAATLAVTDAVAFQVRRGEILALVGESGCGKSLTCLALTKLLPPGGAILSGSIRFTGKDGKTFELTELTARQLRKVRGGRIGYIFQEPAASLNPVFRVGDQIAEVLALHRRDVEDVDAEVERLLGEVGISDPARRKEAFPHELSGGMQQRVMIAMALAGAPELLIADEPTTALDVTIQVQILELLDQLRRKTGMAVILVTHNLGIVAQLADRVAVMYGGMMAECGPTREVLAHPAHPYTEALLRAVPRLGRRDGKLATIPGQVPLPGNFPPGCRFAPRCPHAAPECSAAFPAWREVAPEHLVCCRPGALR